MPASLTQTPADVLKLQNDIVRTKKYISMGRMRTIAIGHNSKYVPPPDDPIIKQRGRMIDLSMQFLPIAQDPNSKMILITAPLLRKDGTVGLPDLVDPTWRAEAWSEEEVKNYELRDPAKDRARLIPQRLEDRTNEMMGNFLVFQPVLRITYQPEITGGDKQGFQPYEWRITFAPDHDGVLCALLVDPKTGESHFFGGTPVYEGDARG